MAENLDQNFILAMNQKFFTISLLTIMDLVEAKSNEMVDLTKLDTTQKAENKLHKAHTRLRLCCQEIRRGFTSDGEYDQGRIIKKIYKTLSANLDKLDPEPQISLFSLKNEEGATMTIIPGCDLGLVVGALSGGDNGTGGSGSGGSGGDNGTGGSGSGSGSGNGNENENENELATLWNHLYMMFIASVKMITITNNHKKDGRVWELLPKFQERIMRAGLIVGRDRKTFNPFLGLQMGGGRDEDGNGGVNQTYGVDQMFTNVEDLRTGDEVGMSMEDVFKMFGIDKLGDFGDISQLNEQLKNCKQEDIDNTANNLTELLGAENDGDVKDACHTLVTEIVSDLKVNGLTNMFDTAKSVSSRIGSTIDKKTMMKTASKLQNIVANGEDKIKGMKNEEGENIGEQLFEKLKIPLQLVQSMQRGQNLGRDGNDEVPKKKKNGKNVKNVKGR